LNFEKHVKIGDSVEIHFSGKLEDGTIFDSSRNKKPLSFRVGNNEVLQGIDDAVIGMKVNQEKTININSDVAYGAIERELIITIDKNKLPSDLELELGQELEIPNEDGNPITVRITNMTDDSIELDGNHPLAGKNVIFEIRLLKIK